MTPAKLLEVQARLDEGEAVPAVARVSGVLANTIHKAIRAGRLRSPAKKNVRPWSS